LFFFALCRSPLCFKLYQPQPPVVCVSYFKFSNSFLLICVCIFSYIFTFQSPCTIRMSPLGVSLTVCSSVIQNFSMSFFVELSVGPFLLPAYLVLIPLSDRTFSSFSPFYVLTHQNTIALLALHICFSMLSLAQGVVTIIILLFIFKQNLLCALVFGIKKKYHFLDLSKSNR